MNFGHSSQTSLWQMKWSKDTRMQKTRIFVIYLYTLDTNTYCTIMSSYENKHKIHRWHGFKVIKEAPWFFSLAPLNCLSSMCIVNWLKIKPSYQILFWISTLSFPLTRKMAWYSIWTTFTMTCGWWSSCFFTLL